MFQVVKLDLDQANVCNILNMFMAYYIHSEQKRMYRHIHTCTCIYIYMYIQVQHYVTVGFCSISYNIREYYPGYNLFSLGM